MSRLKQKQLGKENSFESMGVQYDIMVAFMLVYRIEVIVSMEFIDTYPSHLILEDFVKHQYKECFCIEEGMLQSLCTQDIQHHHDKSWLEHHDVSRKGQGFGIVNLPGAQADSFYPPS